MAVRQCQSDLMKEGEEDEVVGTRVLYATQFEEEFSQASGSPSEGSPSGRNGPAL